MIIGVIGANGFIASHLVKELIGKHKVLQIYNSKVNRLMKDVASTNIGDFLIEKPTLDCIVFMSSNINFHESIESIDSIYKTNVQLLRTIVEFYKETRLIYLSSCSIFGGGSKMISENSCIDPITSYSLSKLWGEIIIKQHSKNYTIIRASSVFGIGMKLNTFLPKIIIDSLKKNKITLFGDGLRIQNFIPVEQLVKYLMFHINEKGTKTIIATHEISYSNLEIAKKIKKLTNCKIEFKNIDNSPSFNYSIPSPDFILESKNEGFFDQKINDLIKWIEKTY
jgi:nucleoside-diphosphate-sugar epimerase